MGYSVREDTQAEGEQAFGARETSTRKPSFHICMLPHGSAQLLHYPESSMESE